MTRPLAILAVVVLFLNDHVLKHAFPGFVTGKLSDVAGMIFFPLLSCSLAWPLVPHARRSERLHDRMLLVACVATALVFAATKTFGPANEAYRVTWGLMLWPLRAIRALAAGAPVPGFARVVLVRDPSDLLAIPFVTLAWLSGRARRPDDGAVTRASGAIRAR